MAITVDTDTYISLADSETYVTENYVSTDAKCTTWDGLTDDNKEVYLRKAASLIDRQPLVGIKAESTQTMEFPRAIYTDYNRRDLPVLNTNFNSDWYVQTETPQAVKYAQVEIALEFANGVSSRAQLQREGVKSYSIGNLSETLAGKSLSVVSHEARELLRPYLAGTVRI